MSQHDDQVDGTRASGEPQEQDSRESADAASRDDGGYQQTDDSGTTTGAGGMGSLGHAGEASTGDTAEEDEEADGAAQASGAGTDAGSGQGSAAGAPNAGTSTAPRTDPSMQPGGQHGPGETGDAGDAGERGTTREGGTTGGGGATDAAGAAEDATAQAWEQHQPKGRHLTGGTAGTTERSYPEQYGGGQSDPQDNHPRRYGSTPGHGMDGQEGAANAADPTGGYGSGGLGDDPVSRQAQAGQQSQGPSTHNTAESAGGLTPDSGAGPGPSTP